MPRAATIEEPRHRLIKAARQALTGSRRSLARIEISVEPMDALAWLYAQPWPDRVFWDGRDDGWTMAGAGIADRVDARSMDALELELRPRLATGDPALRYFGAMRFRSEIAPSGEWEAFPPTQFVLPRIELRISNFTATLAVNVAPDDSVEMVEATIAAIEWDPPNIPGALPEMVGRADCPDEPGWLCSVDQALATMQTTDLKKVVLARRTSYVFDAMLDPFILLSRMGAARQHCFQGLICFGQGTAERTAFLTATPERLFRMEGGEVISEAVAGSRVRSSDLDRDRLLGNELLHSEKDRREQLYVLEAIRSALDPVTINLQFDSVPSVLNLSHGRHLRSMVKGSLAKSVTAFDLLRRLHPTPAVCGSPRDLALNAISELETFDRGLYAGPIGWIGRDDAEFAVGIRSGLVAGNRLHLYSGAGIVEGSDAGLEWDEIEHKLDDFSVALGLVA